MDYFTYVILRWFAGQRAMFKFLPGGERWAEDPIACLYEHPVIIGRTFPAIQTIIMSAMVVGLFMWQGAIPPDFTFATIAFAAICAIVLVPQLLLFQHHIVMTSEGLEIGTTSRHLFVPWHAFALPQTALINRWKAMSFALRPGCADLIECREQGQIVARGYAAHVFAARLLNERTLKIRGWYRAHPFELSEVVLGICESIEKSQDHADRGAQQIAAELKTRVVEQEYADFVEVRILQLQLPECCCGCMDETYKLRDIDSRGIFLAKQGLIIPVPICARCWRRFWTRRIAAVLCALFFVAVATALSTLLFQAIHKVIIVAILCAMAAIVVAAIFAERRFSPCYVFRYDPRHETVRLRIRNEQYRNQLIESAAT